MSNDSKPTGSQGEGYNRPSFFQRKYLVDKPFQYRLIGTFLTVWLANSLFFALVLYFLYDGHLNQFYELVPRSGVLPLFTLPALFGLSVLFISLFGVIVLGIIALYMSNQIAGPLHRTKKCLDRVGQGDWKFELQFRHGDFLNDFPDVFNRMLEGLRRQSMEELEELKSIEAVLDSDVRARVKKLRERKEAQLGLSEPAGARPGEEPESVSVAVH